GAGAGRVVPAACANRPGPLRRALPAPGEGLARAGALGQRAAAQNRALMRLWGVLIPLLYTTGDRFAHDLAVGIPPLAGLGRRRELAPLDPASDRSRFTVTALRRERNRLLHALDQAAGRARELAALSRSLRPVPRGAPHP